MRKTLLITTVLAALLAGCASGVKLNDVPVEDKGAIANTSGLGNGQDNSSGVSNVVAKQAGAGIGPINTPHVVYFDYDSFTVRDEALPVIQAHAKFLQANKQRKAMLEGHTDERGGREYNLALGQKRAEAVQRRLIQLGVSDSQVEAVSYGKEKPAEQGSDEAAYAKNRRVEFKY